jgi:MHS family proline/betaine transporter-like MFS transporter
MRSKLIAAGLIGTFLEIYDMSVYGFFAPLIASNFFPSLAENSALLSTFSIFFIGFVVRPAGALLFGHIGDVKGRKKALVATIILMSIATCGIGLLPTTQHIGIFAPLLLIVMRILQGLSFSAEYAGSLIFLLEQAPPARKNFVASWATTGGNLGLLGASVICWLTTYLISADQLQIWGWRLPFLLACLGGILGVYLRIYIAEHVPIQKETTSRAAPAVQLMTSYKKDTLLIIAAVGFYVIINYLFLVYIPTYLKSVLHFSIGEALAINSGALALLVLLIPVFAALSDKVGKQPLLLAGALGVIVMTYPYFVLLQQGTLTAILLAEFLIIIPSACFLSILPLACAEQIAKHIRFTGMALAYNISAVIFGGTTPLIAIWLLQERHNYWLMSAYVILLGLLAVVACLQFRSAASKADDNIQPDISILDASAK